MKNACVREGRVRPRSVRGLHEQLPTDVEALRRVIAEQDAALVESKNEIVRQNNEILRLTEHNRLLRHELYGSRSEKLKRADTIQARLFNEAEHFAAPAARLTQASDANAQTDSVSTTVKSHTRQKPGKKPFPAELPRVDIVYDLDESDKICGCGASLTRIGEKTSERLDIIPPRFRIERHIRLKYACRVCEGTGDESRPAVRVGRARLFLKKSLFSAGFVAWLLTAKFCDAIPFYRLEGILGRFGIRVGRATMCNLALQAARECEPALELLWAELLKGPVLHIDETTLQVLKEPGRAPQTKSYMWVFRGGTRDGPVILYEYRESRGANFLKERLKNYQGVVVTDGFPGYERVFRKMPAITHVSCWAHARRKFFDAQKVAEDSPLAISMLKLIGGLYTIEEEARRAELAPEKLRELRWEKSRPVIREIRRWLKTHRHAVLPKSELGKAIFYTIKRWRKLLRFLRNGVIPLDNNLVENDIRPFVVGRKNWLFNDTPRGARASAFHYSFMQTARANGHDPYWSLRFFFMLYPQAEDDEQKRDLLPHRVSPVDVRAFFAVEGRD